MFFSSGALEEALQAALVGLPEEATLAGAWVHGHISSCVAAAQAVSMAAFCPWLDHYSESKRMHNIQFVFNGSGLPCT